MTVRATDGFSAIRSALNDLENNFANSFVDRLVVGDQSDFIATGTKLHSFRIFGDRILSGLRASLEVAQDSGSIVTVDVLVNDVSILSTPITFTNGDTTSTLAGSQPVISDPGVSDDDEISIDVTQVGDGTAKGLKVTLIWEN